jgi:hypothetical protein
MCSSFRPKKSEPEAGKKYADEFFNELIVEKTWERLVKFADESQFSIDHPIVLNGVHVPSVRHAVQELIDTVRVSTSDDIRLWHGDFFFGNILFDLRANRIKVVDPRGMVEAGRETIYGDWRYDQAKLVHSIFGRYDHILAGYASLKSDGLYNLDFALSPDSLTDAVEEDLKGITVAGLPILTDEIKALSALLFFSMLPLHSDGPLRQMMLLANGLRMYVDITGNNE